MIYGNINVKMTQGALSPTLLKALEVIRTTDITGWAPGKYPVDEDRMILQVNETTTEPKQDRRAEVHRKYIDVQYMVEGREYIGCYPDRGEDKVTEDRLESGDICFYEYRDVPEEVMIPMTPGNFAVFFPEDVHRPCCAWDDGPSDVRKIIMKVRVDTL